ncbi:MAG: AraC family transcriptional regulator [Clostridiales bacterium]|nr:AraC family transcriptional regulator [Clostridiales bacterium]
MKLAKEWYLQETKDSEEEKLHSSMNGENAFFHAVSVGDIEFVRRNYMRQCFGENSGMGVLSRNPVTNLKYHFVIAVAMITRVCIASGMEAELAFRLSDFYIIKLDNLHTVQEVSALHERMAIDFTEKMRLHSGQPRISKPVAACMEYVYVHIKERITIDDLAEHTGLSTGYLSRLFKKETGMSVSSYIRAKKIEKAENLLKFCDYSMVEITNYLSFSSQSHFIQLFKKYTGMTPKKYRSLYSTFPTENAETEF